MAAPHRRVRVLIAGGLIIGLLVIELAARRAGKPDARRDPAFVEAPEWVYSDLIAKDPDLFWRYRPSQMIREGFFAPGTYTINAHGFRGPEFDDEKPSGTIRVVCFGGSTTFGWGVADTAAYPRQLEIRLNELDPQHRRWQVINAGVTDYSTHQGIALARRWLPEWTPDVVLFSFAWGDHQPAGLGVPDKNLALPPLWRRTLEDLSMRSAAVRWVSKVLGGTPEGRARESLTSPAVWRVSPADFNANAQKLVGLARDAGARVIWVTAPISWPPDGASDTSGIFLYHHEYSDIARYGTRAAGGEVAELANAFNLFPEFYDNPSRDTEHFNEAGHAFAGEFLARFVLGLDPPRAVTQRTTQIRRERKGAPVRPAP